MKSNEIQELLEGMLGDEQTAEVLHRLSVSPEKRTAFRQHMALRGALEEDSRSNSLSEEEDDAAWAAILGATGGATVVATSGSWGGWLMRGAALLVAGVAGFFIGTGGADDVSTDNRVAMTPAVVQQSQSDAPDPAELQTLGYIFAPAGAIAGNTLYNNGSSNVGVANTSPERTRIVYRDRYRYVAAPSNEDADAQQLAATDNNGEVNSVSTPISSAASYEHLGDALNKLKATEKSTVTTTIREETLADLLSNKGSINDLVENNGSTPVKSSSETDDKMAVIEDPQRLLEENDSDEMKRSPNGETPDPANASKDRSSIVRGGFEIAYNERIGRIAPVPEGLQDVDPGFSGRAIDLTYRIGDGNFGFGTRLLYGTFATVELQEEVWFSLGLFDTIFQPTLKAKDRLTTELFANYRIPLFGDKVAISLEANGGLSPDHYKYGADISFLYLFTDWLGLQAGGGFSNYVYRTQEIREQAFEGLNNTGVTSGLSDSYKGSMFEGRYGLFFRF